MRNEIVKNMNIEEYHKHDGISNSAMSYLLDCPARYYTEYLDPNKPEKERPAHYILGSAVHTLVLEPQKFQSLFYIMPKCDRRTTKGKEDYALHTEMAKDKELLNEEQYAQVIAMRDSIFKRIKWLEKILSEAHIEESFFWVDKETGVQLKSRPDLYTQDFYIDLKTTSNIQRDAYTRSVTQYGYHRQAALAREALLNLRGVKYTYFMHIVVEEQYPYLTACYEIHDEFLQKGDEEFRKAAQTYKICKERNDWPDYGQQVQQLYLPAYLR